MGHWGHRRSRSKIFFWSKLFFYAGLFLFIGAVFCGLNFAIIQMSITQIAAFAIFIGLIIFFFASLGLGLGAIFPNFEK